VAVAPWYKFSHKYIRHSLVFEIFHTNPGKTDRYTERKAVPSREGIGNVFYKAEF